MRAKLFAVLVLALFTITTAQARPLYDDAGSYESCSTSIPQPTVTCTSASSASAGTGALSARSGLVSRLQGYAPTPSASATAGGWVTQEFTNTGTIQALRITATVHVTEALAKVLARPRGIGYGDAYVDLVLSANDYGTRCFIFERYCAFQTDVLTLVSQTGTGEDSVEDLDVTLVGVFYSCEGLPAGAVRADVALSSASYLGSLTVPSAGNAESSASATVTSITAEPASVPAGVC